jgi:hypothetical protein
MSYIGASPIVGNFQVCDAISVVNGQAAYTMQVGGVNVFPETANHMLVSLNGILQKAGSSFTISGSTITFSSNLVTGDVIDFIQILGDVLDLGVPSDSTVSLAKLTATGTKDATTFLRGDNTFAEAGGGKINQVVQTVNSTISQMSSSSFADVSGMSVAITPSASDSKILITVSLYAGQNQNSVAFFKLLRGSTVIGSASDVGSRVGCNFSFGVDGNDGHSQVHSNSYSYLDSPSTTSATTYKIQGASYNNATLTFNRTPNDADHVTTARCTSVITAMEVLA